MYKKMRALFFVACKCVSRVCNEETPPNVVCVHIISRLIFFIFAKTRQQRTRRTVGLVHLLLLFLLSASQQQKEQKELNQRQRSENFQKKERNTLLASSSSSLCGISDEESNERNREREMYARCINTEQ